MTSTHHSQPNGCIHDWLMRVYTQDEAIPEQIKTADYLEIW